MALNMLWGRPLRFGHDIVYTYGPWGIVWGGYYPTTFPITCAVWVAIAIATWLAGWRMVMRPRDGGAWSGVAAAIALVIWSTAFSGGSSMLYDARILLLPFFIIVLHFLAAQRREFDWVIGCVVAVCGFTGMIKFPYLVAGAMAVGTVTLDQLAGRRFRFQYLAIYLLSVLGAWLGAGQRLGDLPAYLTYSLEMTSGYADAMAGWVSREYADVAFSLIAMVAMVVFLLLVTRQKMPTYSRLLLAGSVTGLCWLVLRAAYVRHDMHEIIATNFICVAAPTLWLATWPIMRGQRLRHGLALTCVMIALAVHWRTAQRFGEYRFPLWPGDAVRSVVSLTSNTRRAVVGETTDPRRAFDKVMAIVRRKYPLPKIEGSVDFVSSNTTVLAANQFDYDPRPTLQGYAAYTPRLNALNAEKIASDRGPQNVLFQVDPIDVRLPSMEEGTLWVELLRHYQVAGDYPPLLHLTRRPVGRTSVIKPYATTTMQFGQRIDVPVPPGGTGLVWAQVHAPVSRVSKLAGTAFKPPIAALLIWDRAGRQNAVRFLPANAEGGFLLSPVVLTADVFGRLLDNPRLAADEPNTVTAIQLSFGNDAYAKWYYGGQTISVTFSEVTVSEP